MKKVIRLTESDLARIVRRVISEQAKMPQGATWACYSGAENYQTGDPLEGNQVYFEINDKRLGEETKYMMPKAQKTRGQYCGTPSINSKGNLIITGQQGVYECTDDCRPSGVNESRRRYY